jgi:hypothetical protein
LINSSDDDATNHEPFDGGHGNQKRLLKPSVEFRGSALALLSPSYYWSGHPAFQ